MTGKRLLFTQFAFDYKYVALHLPGGQVAQQFPTVWLAGIGFGQDRGGQRTALQFVRFPAQREQCEQIHNFNSKQLQGSGIFSVS